MALNSTNFSVLYVNSRSVLAHNNTKKLDEIEFLATEYNFSVVCSTETWLNNSNDNVSVPLHGYSDRIRLILNRQGGGFQPMLIFCVHRYDFEANDAEILWLELKTNEYPLSLHCGMLPSAKRPTNSILKQKYPDCLFTVLKSLLVNPDCCVLIIGDFNDHSVFKPIQLPSNLFRTLSEFVFINLSTLLHDIV